jgi:hypothetical protein
MQLPELLQPLARAMVAVERLFETANQPGIIIGGVAVCLCAEPRNTVDVDASILLAGSSESAILAATRSVGMESRIRDAEDFARKKNLFLLTHVDTGRDIDLSLAILPFEEDAIRMCRQVDLGGFQVHLPTVEHLAAMKAVAARPDDLADIRRLLRANPTLNRAKVLGWVTEFAEALEAPELVDQLKTIFTAVPGLRRRRR